MRILLTGGSGLVGRNFLEQTFPSDWEVLAPGRKELDLLDAGAVGNFITRSRPDFVVHAAGKVGGIHANIKEPTSFLLQNFDVGRNVVCAARDRGVKRLLNLGTSCMYPRNAPNPLKEDMILTGEPEPTNEGYAIAKIAVSRLCDYIRRDDPEFQYKTLVPCNQYGRWDYFDPAKSHLIGSIINKLHAAKMERTTEIEIWGDGSARREYMYAGDLAGMMKQALERFEELPPLMNVGVGRDYSIDEYYEAAAAVVGFKGTFVHDLSKPVGMTRKLVDVSKQQNFGWRTATSLSDGVAKTYEFYLSRVPA